jgi:long-chain acyl-CoA synthetase
MYEKEEPWFKIYNKLNIPKEINIDDNENLLTFLKTQFEKFHDLPMYENMNKIFTFGEVDKISKSIANFLMEKFDKGDAIAVHMPNIIQMPVAIISILRAGMKVVTLNPLYTPTELEYMLKDAGVKGIFTLENFAFNLASVYKNTALKTVIVTSIGDIFGTAKRCFINFILRHVKKIVPSYKFDIETLDWKTVIKEGKDKQYVQPQLSNEDISFIQYTSGTTCKAKGVLISHKNILANIKQIATYCYPLEEGKEIFFTPLPLYHSYALMLNFWTPLHLGAMSALITNPKKVQTMIDCFRFNKISVIIAIKPLFKLLLQNEKFLKLDFSNIKVGLSGGTAIDHEVEDAWFKLTKKHIVSGFGLTEASPCVACNFIDNINFKDGTVGVPLPSTEIKIVDLQTGKEVGIGEEGNMWIRGPQVSKGYLNNPVENEKNFVDGWLVSGDVVKIDEDGFLTIVGRVKEMLNISGFNVSPYEIESIYNAHPDVAESIAIKAVDEKGHDTVKLFVIKKNPNLTEKDLFIYGTKFLTNYKRPHIIEFVDEFPKSQLGKVLRYRLK